MIGVIEAIAKLGEKGLELALEIYKRKYKVKLHKLKEELLAEENKPRIDQDDQVLWIKRTEIEMLKEDFEKEIFGG